VKLRIKLEGVSYDVEVEFLPEDEAAQAEDEMEVPESVLQPPLPPDTRPEDKICRSPIAGVIVSVAAQVGDNMQEGDPLAVIEAMKMQTTIGAPVAGTVESVITVPGQSVKPGQVLCKLK
jgi:biotin carboxyl carrier protein